MKNFMMKIVKIFKENVWLSVVAVVLMFCLGLAGWKCSLHTSKCIIFRGDGYIISC